MYWIRGLLLCLFCVEFSFAQGTNNNLRWDFNSNNEALSEEGSGKLPFSDDEDFGMSGSGSGSGDFGMEGENGDIIIDEPMSPMTVPPRRAQPPTRSPSYCEKTRDNQARLYGQSRPQCMDNGEYEAMQCGEGNCWCSDKDGAEIPGTLMESPNMPDCDLGSNLSPCVFQLVEHRRSSSSSTYQPKCSQDGQFYLPKQCSGSMCFCVDQQSGMVHEETRMHRPGHTLRCDDDVDTVELPIPENPKKDDKKDYSQNRDDIVIDGGSDNQGPDVDSLDEIDYDLDRPEDNENIPVEVEDNHSQEGNTQKEVQKTKNTSVEDQIMTQPGILAGIIGGSVVLLLCLVLLVMFIVYRMRKKDEGSYPIDETNRRMPNYSYHHVRGDKEFYA